MYGREEGYFEQALLVKDHYKGTAPKEEKNPIISDDKKWMYIMKHNTCFRILRCSLREYSRKFWDQNVEENLSVVKERNTLQQKEILQKAGKMLINVILNYFPCYSFSLEIPQVSYAIWNANVASVEGWEALLNSQSKAANEVDELKHQIIQLQQMTSTKQSQNKRGSEHMWELNQMVCS